jgi:hypothetical protein
MTQRYTSKLIHLLRALSIIHVLYMASIRPRPAPASARPVNMTIKPAPGALPCHRQAIRSTLSLQSGFQSPPEACRMLVQKCSASHACCPGNQATDTIGRFGKLLCTDEALLRTGSSSLRMLPKADVFCCALWKELERSTLLLAMWIRLNLYSTELHHVAFFGGAVRSGRDRGFEDVRGERCFWAAPLPGMHTPACPQKTISRENLSVSSQVNLLMHQCHC